MKYRDRSGNEFDKTTKQDEFLADAYSSSAGRALMKFLSLPIFSKLSRIVMDSAVSVKAIDRFIEKNEIDMSEYEQVEYSSFNNFFTRKIKEGRRFITKDEDVLVSPSDGKVSAYKIGNSSNFIIKNSVYTVDSILRDHKLAERYRGGTALIIRLSVDDYHRYCYPCSGIKSHNRYIDGFLHTVNPVINEHYPVYKENCREYCLIRSERLGDVVQMEVGALMVGKISNHRQGVARVKKGEEKGCFEFGGSTIVLLVEKDKVEVCEDLLMNTQQGFETKVLQGEALGIAK
ncbi:MAG: phosphatidylserine decarboxylase [Oscillospiraceae bacterium]